MVLTAGLMVITVPTARAQKAAAVSTVVRFNGSNGSLSGYSTGFLVQGNDGNFYGTTGAGGTNDGGTVFRFTLEGALTTLYNFTGDSNGSTPGGPLVQGSNGNFYGTTSTGGENYGGTFFEITPAGMLTTLHSFDYSEGDTPSWLLQGNDGNFYGTDQHGGSNGSGAVFKITSAGTVTTLYSFTGQNDGSTPSGLVQGSDGNFYGITESGGSDDEGTVFQLTLTGAFQTLHSFLAADGYSPVGLVAGSDGNLYGTTNYGASTDGFYSYGSVFVVTPAGVFTTLHRFTDRDGVEPNNLVQGNDGNFYGTTFLGGGSGNGSGGDGTLFEVSSAGVLATLYTFGNGDNANPISALLQASDGSFYGMTRAFDGDGYGTVFHLSFPPPFFSEEQTLEDGVDYLAFANGNFFGYYSFLADPNYIYHYDLGFEYVFDAADGKSGVYFYDFASSDFFYTSSSFPFPYLYDFNLGSVLYYYPDPVNAGHYNTDGVRYFYDFNTGQIITK